MSLNEEKKYDSDGKIDTINGDSIIKSKIDTQTQAKIDKRARTKRNNKSTYSAITMFRDTIDNVIDSEATNDDSMCHRFLRKKFICIVIFFLACITALNAFTTVTEKLSDEHVSQIYSLLAKNIKKLSKTLTKMSNNTNFYNITSMYDNIINTTRL
jgi:hypothetical protein